MLNLTREYKLLLRYGGNPLSATHPQQLPPVPLSPFAFSVLGRLSSLQGVADGTALIANIQAVSVKTALKKAQQPPQQSAHPSGHIAPGQLAAMRPQARTPEELAAVARAAENPFWLPELQRHVQQQGNAQPCRYIIVEDLLHPNSISRFHFLIKRVQLPGAASSAQQQQQPAAAASSAGAQATSANSGSNGAAAQPAAQTAVASNGNGNGLPTPSIFSDPAQLSAPATATAGAQQQPTPGSSPQQQQQTQQTAAAQYRYYIMDLGSLNGLYIDGIKVRHQLWTPLHEGARLRFAPQTKNAKSYIAAFQAADAANEMRRRASIAAGGTGAHGTFQLIAPVLPQMPLSVKDMHIEYLFTHAMNEAAVRRAAQLNSVVAASGEVNGLLEASLGAAAHPAVPISWSATPIMTAAAATSSSGNGGSPAVGSSAWHQNSALLARQREAEAANQAFYSRFASKGPPVSSTSAAPIQDDEDINAAPLPSNFDPTVPLPGAGVVSRKRGRDSEPAAASSGSATASGSKRARATASRNRPARVLSAYMAYTTQHRAGVRAELIAAHLAAGGTGQPANIFADTTREVAARWKRLSTQEKEKYQTKAAAINQQAGLPAPAAAAAASSASAVPVSASDAPLSAEEEAFGRECEEDEKDEAERRVSVKAEPDGDDTRVVPSAREVLEVLDDDEDMPIVRPSTTAPSSSAAAAAATTAMAAASSSAAAASTSSAAHVSSIFEEFTCGICSDIIYKFVVLDCGHSFCGGCIDEWFKKKKVCPVCRSKHKGAPRQVRSVDNVIAMMVQHNCTPAEKAEREVRIRKADEDAKQAAERKADRDRAKVARDAERAVQRAMQPADRIAAALAAPRSAAGMMRAEPVLLDSDEDDDDYFPRPDDFDEDDGFFAPEFDEDEDAEEEDSDEDRYPGLRAPRMMAAPRMAAAAAPPRAPPAAAAAAGAGAAAAAPAPAPAPAPAAGPAAIAAALAAASPAMRVFGGQSFSVDLAPNARSKCRTCNTTIQKFALRIKQQMSSNDKYFHLRCFTESHPAHFVRGRLAGLENLPAEQRREAEALI